MRWQRNPFPFPRSTACWSRGRLCWSRPSARGSGNIMTMSWHTMIEFEPPLVGCVISDRNYTFGILKATKECVINIPTVELAAKVVGCGNTSGAKTDKFATFRSHAGGRHASQGAAHRRMLCESRMPGRRYQDDGQVLPLHPGSDQSVDRPLGETPADDSSSRERAPLWLPAGPFSCLPK